MKNWILGVILAVMVGWTAYDLLYAKGKSAEEPVQTSETSVVQEMSGETGLAVGDLAPDFELTTLEGETVRLSDYRGQRVFLNFWATWCPPCRAEMPDMQNLYEAQDVPFEILAVNLTKSEASEENVEAFIQDFGLSFPVLLDKESIVAEGYSVTAVPSSYIIDTEGRISFVAPGAMHYDMMAQEIEKMN